MTKTLFAAGLTALSMIGCGGSPDSAAGTPGGSAAHSGNAGERAVGGSAFATTSTKANGGSPAGGKSNQGGLGNGGEWAAGGNATGGTRALGGATSQGGTSSQGGIGIGGEWAAGGNATGGTRAAGGATSQAGTHAVGGVTSQGGTGTGGEWASGGRNNQGGQASGGVFTVGGAPTAGAPACSDPDGGTRNPYKVASTTIGANGTFKDSCDASGNLVEYSCEQYCTMGSYPVGVQAPTSANIGIACQPRLTGNVISNSVNCGGKCAAGKCMTYCPENNDDVTLVSLDVSTALKIRSSDGTTLSCTVTFTQTGFDCQSTSLSGTVVKVVSLGACDATTSVFGTSLPDSSGNQACTFTCTPP